MKKKLFLYVGTVIILISCLIAILIAYKSRNIQIDIGANINEDHLLSFEYNNNLYHSIDCAIKDGEYSDTFARDTDIYPYVLNETEKDDKMFYVFEKNLVNILSADRFFSYDTDDNVIWLKNTSAFGPDGWLCVKQGYEFPTIDANTIDKIWLQNYETDEKIDIPKEQQKDIIDCLIKRDDLSKISILMKTEWDALCVDYKDSAFSEIIAQHGDDGNISCTSGGSK